MPDVLHGEPTTPPPKSLAPTPRPRALWTVVMAMGAGVAVIGALDLVRGWYGLELARQQVFVEAIDLHFGGLLAPTMGLGAVAVGFMGRGSRKAVRAMSWLFGVMAVAHVALLVSYFLEPDLMWDTLVRGGAYVVLYGWLSYYLWVQTRILAWPARPG